MKIIPNIGTINALIRIAAGFTLLSWATAKLVKRPWRESYLFIIMIAAMKIAEGIVRYCPITALFENCQIMNDVNKNEVKTEIMNNDDVKGEKTEMTEDTTLPYSPI